MHTFLADRFVTMLRIAILLLAAAATSAWAQSPMKCDVNGDRIIDATDIQAIIAARNRPASGPNDPRDANGSKVIDEVDLRMCVQRCTRLSCSTQNSPPKANAGPDQSVPVGAAVQLTGALSTDIDGPNPLTYAWTMTARPAGSSATLANAATVNPTFTVDVAGTYKVSLVASDGIGTSAADEVVISTVNSAPTANAGPDQTRQVGDKVVLNGAASFDPDGNPLLYLWGLVSKPKASTTGIVRPEMVSPTFIVDQPGTYIAQLVVSDGLAVSAPDTVVIATGGNTAPVANAGPDQSVFVGDTVTLNGSGSTDVDGNPLTYGWTLVGKPAGSIAVLANPTTLSPTFVADKAGSYTGQLIVNDGTTNSVPDAVVITTGNTAPVANPKASCAAAANTDCSLAIGSAVGLDGSASTDVDGNALTYSWSLLTRPAGSAAVLTTPTAINAAFTTDAPGDFIVQLIVNDGFVNSTPKTLTITTTNARPTAAATISPLTIPAVPQLMQLDGGSSTDPENQALTYAWSLIAKPAGSTAALSSATASKPTFTADLLGTYTAQLIVSDGFLSSNPVTASASSANQAPIANAGPDQTVVAGVTVQLASAGSSDPEGASLGFFWSLLAKPAGSGTDFNNANAANPTFVADKKGSYVAQLIVNDGTLSSAPDTVQVTATNRAPVAAVDAYTVAQDGSLVIGAAAGVLANDSDADGDPLTAILVGTNPTGLALNANGGFTYTPPAGFNGTTTFQYKANDGTVDSNTVTVSITVTPAALPTVTVSATTPNASEVGPTNGAFTITRTGGDIGAPMSVFIGLTGGAVNSTDYAFINNPVVIAAGQASLVVNVAPLADNATEGDETVVLTILANSAYTIGASNTATVTIADDPAIVQVTATTPNASEVGPTNGVFTITRTGGKISAPMSVFIGLTGDAVNSTDYAFISNPVVIAAGQASLAVNVAPLADNVSEASETVVLTILANSAYTIGTSNTATVTIADDPAIVQVTATTPNASEVGPTNGAFTITRTGGNPSAPMSVFIGLTGSAVNSTDYAFISNPVVIAAGQLSLIVPVVPLPDAVAEGDETVILTIQANSAYTIGASASATVTIADVVLPTVTVVASQPNASETGPINGQFTFTRTGQTTFDLQVNFAIGGTAGNAADYQTILGAVVIPAGQASKTLTITPIADAGIEGDETVILTLQASPTTYLIGSPGSATVTISDGGPNTVTIVATDANASETGPDPGVFTFTRTGPTTFDLQVNFAIGGTAGNAADYQNIVGAVVIPAGQASKTLTITPIADAGIEGDETVILTLQASPTTYLVGSPGSATITISDGVPNTVTIVATDANASETGPDPGVFTFTRTGPTTFDLQVNFAIGGTAGNAADYQNIVGAVVIPAGQASKTLTITPIADAGIEGDETVILTLQASPTTYLIGSPGSATITISDGVPNTVTIVATDANASETGPDPGVFTFTRTGPTTFDLQVNFAIGGTAGNAADYQNILGSVVIPAGQASTTLTIMPNADGTSEPNETVILTLQASPTTYLVGSPSSATVTISD